MDTGCCKSMLIVPWRVYSSLGLSLAYLYISQEDTCAAVRLP